MTPVKLPSLTDLHDAFSYDGDVLRWRFNDRNVFSGKPAGNHYIGSRNERAQFQVTYQGRRYSVARVIWYMVTGEQPRFVVAMDGDRTNTNIHNLGACAHVKVGSLVKTVKGLRVYDPGAVTDL